MFTVIVPGWSIERLSVTLDTAKDRTVLAAKLLPTVTYSNFVLVISLEQETDKLLILQVGD